MDFLTNAYWVNTKEALAAIASIATVFGVFGVFAAIAAAVFTAVQVNGNRRLMQEADELETKRVREAGALELHRDYLLLCIEYPELSSSPVMLKSLRRTSFADILVALTPSSERALWFLSYVLHTMEQLHNSTGSDVNWRATIEAQIEYHAPLLFEVWEEWRDHYGPSFQAVVDRVLERIRAAESRQA